MLEDGHCLKDHALSACNRPELRAEAQMLGTSLHTLVQMVDNDLGVTLLPEMAIDAGLLRGTSVVARPLGPTAPFARLRWCGAPTAPGPRSEEHTSELQSLMRNSYAVFCLKNKRHLQTLHEPTSTEIHPKRESLTR